MFVRSTAYQAHDQITNKWVWVVFNDVVTAESQLKKKKKRKLAWWNIIHWGVNMQTQSLICYFINFTASVRWPNLLFSVCVVVNKGSFVCVWCKQNVGEHPRILTERSRCGFLSAQDKTQTDKSHNAAFLCPGYLIKVPEMTGWMFSCCCDTKLKDLFSLLNNIQQLTSVSVCKVCFHFTF